MDDQANEQERNPPIEHMKADPIDDKTGTEDPMDTNVDGGGANPEVSALKIQLVLNSNNSP